MGPPWQPRHLGPAEPSFSWNSRSVPNGNHTLQLRARDAAGNTGTSGTVTVSVQNTTVDGTAPTSPTGLRAVAGTRQATLS
jgi:hypothetical protein